MEKNKEKIIFVCPKGSDATHTGLDLFDHISLFEEGKPSKETSSHREVDFDMQFDRYFSSHPELSPSDVRFYFYNSKTIYSMAHAPTCLFIGANPPSILHELSQKHRFRDLAGDYSIPYELATSPDDLMKKAANLYDEHGHIVVQECDGFGGKGTYFIDTATELLEMPQVNFPVLISRYLPDAISVNMHMIIYENEALLEPGSIQLLQGPRYRGADFALYQQLPDEIRETFEHQCATFAQEVARKGYRGVIGIDGLVSHGEVFLLECNARFQGSSLVLNIMHEKAGLPSLHQLHLEAFEKPVPEMIAQHDLEALNDHLYSVSVYSYDFPTFAHAMEMKELYERSEHHIVFSDVLVPEDESQIRENELIYRVIYDHGIAQFEDDQTKVRICEGPNALTTQK